jgi:23S rRNA (uridine2552-2'-O)-methyltransferase
MSRGGSGGRQRVRTARGRTAASTRWLERQLNDPYVRRAKAEGYRSRAAYKLIELDERFALLKGVKRARWCASGCRAASLRASTCCRSIRATV